MWSEKLIELTRTKACSGSMMKKSNGKFGMIKRRGSDGIKIVAVELKDFMPVPTDKVIASYKNIDEMISDGWVID